MKERLDAYLKEYDMLVAETRLWLAASDPKLTVAFATSVALASAGAWKDKYPLILLIPFVIIFLTLILAYQLDNIIRLGSQLAVVEERINEIIGTPPALTYHSRTVIAVFDLPWQRHPVTGRRRLSLNAIYNGIVMTLLFFGGGFAARYGFLRLRAEFPFAAKAYAAIVIAGAVTCGYLLVRASTAKRWYLALIRHDLTLDGKDLGAPPALEPKSSPSPEAGVRPAPPAATETTAPPR